MKERTLPILPLILQGVIDGQKRLFSFVSPTSHWWALFLKYLCSSFSPDLVYTVRCIASTSHNSLTRCIHLLVLFQSCALRCRTKDHIIILLYSLICVGFQQAAAGLTSSSLPLRRSDSLMSEASGNNSLTRTKFTSNNKRECNWIGMK